MIKLNTSLPPLRAFIQGLNEANGTTFTESTFTEYNYEVNDDRVFNTKISLNVAITDNKYEGLRDISYRRPPLQEVLSKQLGVSVQRIDIETVETDPSVEDVRVSMLKYYRLEVTDEMITLDTTNKEVSIDNIAYFGTMRYNQIMGRIALKDHIPSVVELIVLEDQPELEGDPEAVFKRLLVDATKTETFILNWDGVEIASANPVAGMAVMYNVTLRVPEDHPRYLPGTNTLTYIRPTWQDVAVSKGFSPDQPMKVATYASDISKETETVVRDLERMLMLPTSKKEDWTIDEVISPIQVKMGIEHYILAKEPYGLLEIIPMKMDIGLAIKDDVIDMFEL